MSKVEYQKVVRLSTWAVESNSSFHKMKVWLNISQRVKFQDDSFAFNQHIISSCIDAKVNRDRVLVTAMSHIQ